MAIRTPSDKSRYGGIWKLSTQCLAQQNITERRGGSLSSVRRFPSTLLLSAKASANLECSVCRKTYTNPVILQCGHNLYQVCIDRTMETQKGPACRKRFRSPPTMQRNLLLPKRAQQHQEDSKIFCTYCLDSSVPAVKACLLCDAYLCDKHLRAHNKAPEHVLLDPTTSLQTRKCPTHKELIKYYCIEDGSCICVSCTLAGEHRGHQVQLLDEASGNKKETLRNVLHKLLTMREETKERVRSLQEHRKKVEEEAAGDTERVTALFIDLRRRLEVLEKRTRKEIPGRAVSIVKMIRDLEIKKDELSRKIRHIEELCKRTDPLTVLQESHTVKTVFWSHRYQKRPKKPERFLSYTQVLSSQGFYSGRHSWDVDVRGSGDWKVGVCYPSIDRRAENSMIGRNEKSWCLDRNGLHTGMENRIFEPVGRAELFTSVPEHRAKSDTMHGGGSRRVEKRSCVRTEK
ncbi:E3 ubiquitin-protein ligase TRIM7-like [Mantella aurantiaca]